MILLKPVFIIAIAVVCVGLIGLASNSAYAGLQATIGSKEQVMENLISPGDWE
jgi:hypothetical protein